MANKDLFKPFLEKYIQLSDKELDAICGFIEVSHYGKKTRVTDIGSLEQQIHWVQSGLLIKYFYKGKDEVVTEIVKRGDLISSFVSFFKEVPSGMIIETLEQSTLYSLSKQNIEWLCDTYPNLQKLYTSLMAEAFIRSDQRNIDKMIYSTKELFMRFMNDNCDLFMNVPQKHLASYLKMKPETFSRLKHLLRPKKNSMVPMS